jgi:cytochrome b561
MTTRRERKARHGYSSLQIALHWTVVALIVLNWFLGQAMEEIFDDIRDGEGVSSPWPAYLHVMVA